MNQNAANTARRAEPATVVLLPAEAVAFGTLPVAPKPRYQAPISVNFPSWSSMAALGPTFETELRKAPKYEYRST